MQTKTFRLSGLTCPSCKKLTERKIAGILGVIGVSVNLETGETLIESERDIQLAEIKDVLNDTHYQVIEQ